MRAFIESMGAGGIARIRTLGRAGLLLWATLVRKPRPFKSFPLLTEQVYAVGVLSLVIIFVSALFVGMVLALQGYNTLDKFGASQELGQLLALSIVRELGPVMTALLVAGRAGSALTAEIGLMKATEQLAAMEMMAVDPLWRVIAPRFWGTLIAMPVLALIFSAVAIWGGYLVGVQWLGVDAGAFWSNMQAAVNLRIDVMSGIIKSVAFGFVVAWIAVFNGYDAQPNAAGMASATTKTVVLSSLAVLGLDFILTTMMIGDW